MNEGEIGAAFRRLADTAEPPADASRRVAALVRRRRRTKRTGLAAVAAMLMVAGGGTMVAVLAGDGSGSNLVARDPSQSSATPGDTDPGRVTCPGGAEPRWVSYDHAGYANFTRLLQAFGATEQRAYVDRATEQIFLLRPDGSAHTVVPWMGDSKSRWFPDGEGRCAKGKESQAPTTQSVTFEIGHCWLGPITIDGRVWDVIEEDQGGSGGMLPNKFTGTGQAWTAGDVALYRDESGAVLTLVPQGDPWALERRFCM